MKLFAVAIVLMCVAPFASGVQTNVFIWNDNPPVYGTGSFPLACDAGPAIVTIRVALSQLNPSIVVDALLIAPSHHTGGYEIIKHDHKQLSCTYILSSKHVNGVDDSLALITATFVSMYKINDRLDHIRFISYPPKRAASYLNDFNCAVEHLGSIAALSYDVDALTPEGDAVTCVQRRR